MKQYFLFLLSLLIGLISCIEIQAQTCLVQGKILDEQTNDAIPFVNIGIKGLATGTFSDNQGNYQIELPMGVTTLVLSCVGYEKQERRLNVDGAREISINIMMTPVSNELSTIVVSGSKYEQKVEKSIATIEVLKSPAIMASNPTSIDKAIDKIPGITIVNNEPQIRGGSGFSSGLGSRVQIMVDDIPILRGDAGRPDWGFLPLDDVEQVEVVKGASSVVYGSSAITGAVNIRTAYPKETPETKINSFIGMYSKPDRSYATPWSGMNPIIYGLSLSHMQQSGNLDFGFGVNLYNDQGYIGGTPVGVKDAVADSVFNKGVYTKRGKIYFNTRVRNKKIEGLTYGINGNGMYNDNSENYFWYDADSGLYRSYPGALSHFKQFSFYVDPYIKYFNKNGNSHSFRNRVYYGNTDANNDQSNRFITVYDEYQHTHKFKKAGDLIMVVGITNIYSHSYGKVFSGILADNGTTTANQNGEFDSENLAVYAQFEKQFFNRLTILLGGRWEYYHIADLTENKPIFRAGLNLQATKTTYLRFSVGQGYRAPSIGERYITTNSGGFGFYPNPDLISETCLSYELGAKQLFRIGKWAGMADVSGFLENYDHYVELTFGIWGHDTLAKSLGFRFLNTGPARIYGIDASLGGEGKIARNLSMSLLVGYTYSVPIALKPDEVYYTSHQKTLAPPLEKDRLYTYANSSSDTSGNILKYRIQSLFKSDLELTYKKRFSIGFTVKYYGYMKNIDIFLYQMEPAMHSGIKKYREDNNDGNYIADIRLSYSFRDFKFSLLVNNFFNTEYSLRPMTIESPRTTSLQVTLHI
ncbi:MAG: TonB-dependent receptor [Bacteroidetes bacterium]|nr:TonB-dependent receptor [Bacteroidota bacterium]